MVLVLRKKSWSWFHHWSRCLPAISMAHHAQEKDDTGCRCFTPPELCFILPVETLVGLGHGEPEPWSLEEEVSLTALLCSHLTE